MSRSLHTTLGMPLDRRDEDDLRRKRVVKRLVAEERRKPRAVSPRVASDAVPITVRDRGPFVHYPASPDDLRNVLSRLPDGVAAGVGGIELCIEEGPASCGAALDPFVGRLRREVLSGVFASSVQGRYRPDGSLIQLFGYVFDPARADRVALELCLRLNMLATFVHELAHHADFSARPGRRQWRAHDVESRERYAEAMQDAWTQLYVVPYLEEAYPSEATELTRWLEGLLSTRRATAMHPTTNQTATNPPPLSGPEPA